jgi:hypothetical protein
MREEPLRVVAGANAGLHERIPEGVDVGIRRLNG